MKKRRPPRLAKRLLLFFLRKELAEEVLGDLEEKFYSTLEKSSKGRAKRNYWLQVIKYLRPFALRKSFYKHLSLIGMYKNYLKISWRGLVRNKVFSSIKIGGFAIGIAACILIALFVQSELTYDNFYQNGDRIFRVANNYQSADATEMWTNLQGPLKPILEENLPEVEKVSRVVLWKWGNVGENNIRKIESKYNIYESGFFYADPELLEILEIPMIYGSQEKALATPKSIVISKSKADVFFPNENPIGRQLVLNDDPNTTFTVGGVMADFPANSHLQGDFILTLKDRKIGPGSSGWCCSNYTFYVKLTPGTSKTDVESKMLQIRDLIVVDKLREIGNTDIDNLQQYESYYLQPIKNLYLNRENVYDHQAHGSFEMLWIFGAIAVIILLIACINFINLSTARSAKRSKEVGIRKVVESHRSGLISQYLAESTFYSFLSVLLATTIAWMALPSFNRIAEKSLVLPWDSLWFIPSLLLGALFIGILAGLYPAFYLSKFHPIQAIKGKSGGATKTAYLRSAMVVFQFAATVILIIGALVTHGQFEHFMNQSLGYDKDQVLTIHGLNSLSEERRDVLKDELERFSAVESATLGDYLPVSGSRMTNYAFWINGRKEVDAGFEAARWIVDEDYITTMDMEVIKGRNFMDITADAEGIIINEAMVRAFGLESPIDTEVIDMFDGKYRIIGVVKDFYFESLAGQIRPLAMVRGKGNNTLSLKVQPENMASTMKTVENLWQEQVPNQPFRYSFLDQRFEAMYTGLVRAKTIFILFSILSIVIACLGLFALSAFTIEQRSKEISVRKVLGASSQRIFALLAKDFIKLVALAIIIAIPIGRFFMNDFLENMANRIDLNWTLFATAACAALMIAFLTISIESIKAATANPANKLRSE